ncbi:zinc finger protein Xfin-like [Harmonia axyridis]|uniref:zinc finger protein Xfin-like n=1 Tax=Harmonia axyridis TaxID=115357 RepID=UPI001E278B41|nr:zinc finger protein Xfin-like [Harmonia axyridis]
MRSSDNLIFKVYKINENGIVSAVEYEQDFYTREVLSKRPISSQEPAPNLICDREKLKLNFSNFECEDEDNPLISFVKIENISDVSLIETSGYSCPKSFIARGKRSASPCYLHHQMRISLNIPTMIRCQNCETNFPTKYQYQRHQCEFNAEKVVLKANADLKDINKGMRIKYDCERCGKQFVSKNNLERHQICHENSKENVCEHCNKQFVSENRLRIHKENHCKKVGDISKFYRSDVAVWKCKKCHEVFSSLNSANTHVESCKEDLFQYDQSDPKDTFDDEKKESPSTVSLFIVNDDLNSKLLDESQIEKILTEILLQCEFCNRTYADKNLLLLHQRKHSTAKNYECVNCKSSFESYAVAAQHWLKICSETSNMFYLPKLTYCEYCDRTFKSHELLYAHKIKKKHYTVKLHMNDSHSNKDNMREKQIDSSETINKLIEDVLITLDRPIGKICQLTKLNYDDSNKENIEVEAHYTQREFSDVPEDSMNNENSDKPEKKKRGRKRKCSKPGIRSKKLQSLINEGYKYQCERCPLVWDNITDLEKHRDEEHAASFSCEDCGQILHSAKALLIHCRAHKCLKPYVCDTCGRSYSQTSHLWQHMRFHQGIKPFACPHEGCEARYTIRPDLKDHIRKVHTRERPFKCAVCNKCFLTGSVYYQHRLIHTNDRRYGCDVCHKRFFRADALNNHKRIHTDERPYPCTVCGREFRQKGDRNKHMRTQHPEAVVQ